MMAIFVLPVEDFNPDSQYYDFAVDPSRLVSTPAICRVESALPIYAPDGNEYTVVVSTNLSAYIRLQRIDNGYIVAFMSGSWVFTN